MLNKNTASPADAGKILLTTRIIFVAIVTGMIALMLVSLFINHTAGPLMPSLRESGDWPAWFVAILSVAGLLWGRRFFHSAIRRAKDSLKPLEEKLNHHRWSLVRYLLVGDIVLVLNIVFFLLAGDFIFQVFAAVTVGTMLAVAPLKRRIVSQLELDASEQTQIT